uniref:Probable proline--tRNA ligase, mitochondrial n=1 Tax=Timema shepardi TaxID=629360 RepID=A0A7R9FWD9_TIMSH|nr:unnamed protein product [Timema shepardi]
MLDRGIIRQASTGTFYLLPLGQRALQKLIKIVDKEMQGIGAQKLLLPLLTSGELWKTTGRWDTAGPELFTLRDRHDRDYVLSPTHEEAITELIASSPQLSHRSLPLRLYQVTSKFRDEMKPRSGLLRGKEFLMKDLYTFDTTLQAAEETYNAVCNAYDNIFRRIEVGYVKVMGDPGMIGGSLSHEYHYPVNVGEDQLLICQECNYGANTEVCGNSEECPQCKQPHMGHCPGIEVGHTFLLGTKYSTPLGASYMKADGKPSPVQMGCYGIGLTRTLAAAVESLSLPDELRWPLAFAPFSVCIIPPKDGSKESSVSHLSENLYESLHSSTPFEDDVLVDDRSQWTIGRRLFEAKKTGYPFIVVVGKKATEVEPLFEVYDLLQNIQLDLFEEEIKRVEEGTLELQQKAVDLDKEKERKLVDLSHKKAQSEFLTNKENMLKALIAEANTTLKKEKDNLAQQQDNIFLKRGKFCNTVREFVEEHGIVATLKKLQLKKQEADKTRSATEDVDDLYDIDENNEEDIELTEMKREVDTLETDLKEVTMQLENREERQKAANKEREQLLKETTEGEEFVSGGMIQDHTLAIDWIADNVADSADKSVLIPARLQEKLLQLREDKKLLNQQCAVLDKQQQQQAAQTQIISKPSSLPASSSSNEGLKLPPATMNISHSRNFTVKQNNNDKHSSNFLPRTQTNAPVLASRKHVSFYCYQEIEEGRDLQFVHKGDEKSFSRHNVDTQVLEASDEDLQETKVTLQRNCSSHDHGESDAGVFRENIKATNYSPLKDYYTDAQDQIYENLEESQSFGSNKGQQPNSTIVTTPKSSKKLNKRVRGKRGGLSKCFVPKVPSKILSKIKIREEHKAQLEQDISNIVRQANKLHH